jgi:two-component system sensor histidine kinase KdpD
MGGTLEPRETPGGGLTMVISLPAARETARADAPGLAAVDTMPAGLVSNG